jgi:uncharacterized membrane protein YdbT with pleckstrin-like domain
MGYVEANLTKNETVTYRAQLHWLIFVFPALLSLVLIGIPFLIGAILRYKTSEFAVTNRRVIIKVGLISRKTLELNLNKIESIGVDQSLIARIFNYGSIVIVGSGGTNEPFRHIADPLAFRRAVNNASEALTEAAQARG